MSAAGSRRRCMRRSLRGSPGTSPKRSQSAGHLFDLTDFLSFRATGSLTRSACTATCKFGPISRMRNGGPDEFFGSVGLGFLKDDDYALIGAHAGAAGRAARAGTDGRGSGGDGLAARDAGRRRADRRPRRRCGHAWRARRRRPRRSAAAARADPRHLIVLHGAFGRAALRRGRVGTAFLRAGARSMAR